MQFVLTSRHNTEVYRVIGIRMHYASLSRFVILFSQKDIFLKGCIINLLLIYLLLLYCIVVENVSLSQLR